MGQILNETFPAALQWIVALLSLAALGAVCWFVIADCAVGRTVDRGVPFGVSRLESLAIQWGWNCGLRIPLPVLLRAAPPDCARDSRRPR
jgi:hypothetical protein